MPEGQSHNYGTLVTATGVSMTASVMGLEPELMAVLITGTMTGLFLSPDLDVNAGCIVFENFRYVFGTPLGTVWRLFWWPYAKLVPHRSFVSHAPFIGTLLRVSYIVAVASVTNIVFKWPSLDLLKSQYFLYWFVGLCASDLIHILMDFWPLGGQKRGGK